MTRSHATTSRNYRPDAVTVFLGIATLVGVGLIGYTGWGIVNGYRPARTDNQYGPSWLLYAALIVVNFVNIASMVARRRATIRCIEDTHQKYSAPT